MNLALEPEQPARTRCGYNPTEVVQSLQKVMNEAGTHSTGRALHFTADLVCSGGIQNLFRVLWEYSLLHIGLASPRVFLYLKQRIKEIDSILKTLPDEDAYKSETFQIRVGELILVLRDAPTRAVGSWPKVGIETHDESWIRGAIIDPVTESAAIRKVWRPEGDFTILRTAGAQLSKAINDGSTERALFWVKWLLEEDALTRKKQKGAALSTIERGPASLSKSQRTDVSYFVIHLYGEIYKELLGKQLVRMTEEFQSLLDIWKDPPKGLGSGAKRQVLVILTQILTEVPRWKVPAAPPLIKDPVYLANAVKQVPKFFHEVLKYESPKAVLKFKGTVIKKPKPKALTPAMTQMEAFDRAMNAYLSK
jgi:hypothetical protein